MPYSDTALSRALTTDRVNFLVAIFGSPETAARNLGYLVRSRDVEPAYFASVSLTAASDTGYHATREDAVLAVLASHVERMAGQASGLSALIAEIRAIVAFDGDAFDSDEPIDGGDLVEFWAQRRPILKALLATLDAE